MNCNYTDTPIFVTGAERSGRTIIAKILKLSGAFTGVTNSMLENEQIKNVFYYHYKAINADPLGQYPLPDRHILPSLQNSHILQIQNGINDILKDEKYVEKEPWMYKSSNLCQLWKIWNQAYPNARWIIVRRKPSDIVYSCLRTTYMCGFSSKERQQEIGVTGEREAWLWWVRQHELMFQEMVAAGLDIKVIWPEDLVDGNYESVKEILDWVGLPFDEEMLRKEIDPMLWKARNNRKE
jgi:hypothetical protein